MRVVNLIVVLALLSFCGVNGLQHAICSLVGQGIYINITGRVDFYGLCDGDTNVIVSAANIPEKTYALQIEQFADQNKNFNPFNQIHGCPGNATHSVGDLGNITPDDTNTVQLSYVIPQAIGLALTGPYSIIGRYIRIYATTDDCIDFPQSTLPAVVAECTLGISNEITFSEAYVDNPNITAGYSAYNGMSVYIQKTNQGLFDFIVLSDGYNGTANANFSFSVQTYGDLIVGVGPKSPLNITIQQQSNNNGSLDFTSPISLTNVSSVIGRGLIFMDSNGVLLGSSVIGVTNSSYVAPITSTSSKHSGKSSSAGKPTSPSTGNTAVWVAVGVSAAAACLLVFGTIFYIKVKNSPGKSLY